MIRDLIYDNVAHREIIPWNSPFAVASSSFIVIGDTRRLHRHLKLSYEWMWSGGVERLLGGRPDRRLLELVPEEAEERELCSLVR